MVSKKKKGLHYFFLRSKPINILMSLKKDNKLQYASMLSKEANCTYSHTVKILNKLKQHGLVEFTKKGRLKAVNLTSVGHEIASNFSKTISSMKKLDN